MLDTLPRFLNAIFVKELKEDAGDTVRLSKFLSILHYPKSKSPQLRFHRPMPIFHISHSNERNKRHSNVLSKSDVLSEIHCQKHPIDPIDTPNAFPFCHVTILSLVNILHRHQKQSNRSHDSNPDNSTDVPSIVRFSYWFKRGLVTPSVFYLMKRNMSDRFGEKTVARRQIRMRSERKRQMGQRCHLVVYCFRNRAYLPLNGLKPLYILCT